jgi:hypothetical protein
VGNSDSHWEFHGKFNRNLNLDFIDWDNKVDECYGNLIQPDNCGIVVGEWNHR